jgi:hypothetical protein
MPMQASQHWHLAHCMHRKRSCIPIGIHDLKLVTLCSIRKIILLLLLTL